jgi:hypothetical protein
MNEQIDWPVYLAECRQDALHGDLAYRDVDRLIDKIERLQAALTLATENEHLFLNSLCLRDTEVVRLETALTAVTAERGRYRAALEGLRRGHRVCEDCWYSCPLSEEGCCDERATECTCGASDHNAIIDAALGPAAGEGETR